MHLITPHHRLRCYLFNKSSDIFLYYLAFHLSIAWENNRHLVTLPLAFPQKTRRRNERRNYILMTHHYPDLGSASDWSCRVGNESTNQKHYPDLGSDASSLWNFCARFADVIWRGKPLVASPNVGCFRRLILVSRVWSNCKMPGTFSPLLQLSRRPGHQEAIIYSTNLNFPSSSHFQDSTHVEK